MTLEKEYFIHLLRSFVNGTVPDARVVDYKSLFELAGVHDLQGVAAHQLKQTDGDSIPEEVKKIASQYVGRTIQGTAIKELALDKIKAFLNDNGIDFIIVKGSVIRSYYPVTELRTSGDIDIIVRESRFEDIVNLFNDSEFTVKKSVTDALTVLVDGINVEIHRNADVFRSYFDDAFDLCSNKGNEYYLGEYDHLAYVIAHLCKHLSYRGAGIRMLLDIDLMIRGIDDFNINELLAVCDKMGLYHSTEVILSLCKLWLGTPYVDAVAIDIDSLLPSLERVFLDGGVFGYEMNSIPLSIASKSRLKMLLRLAFPEKELLRKAYPYYNKNKLLLPVARINRLLDGVTKKRNAALKSTKQLYQGGDSLAVQRALIDELEL